MNDRLNAVENEIKRLSERIEKLEEIIKQASQKAQAEKKGR
jgi:prefoldin subunit 5